MAVTHLKGRLFTVFICCLSICLVQGKLSKDNDREINSVHRFEDEDSDENMVDSQLEQEDEEGQPKEDGNEERRLVEKGSSEDDSVANKLAFTMNSENKCPSGCKNDFTPLGCFKDKHIRHHRPMPGHMLSMRSSRSHVYSGYTLDWHHYEASLQRFLCHCARLSEERGYDYFGIQFYGECWSGHESEFTFDQDGRSSACVNTSFKKCDLTQDCKCTGKHYANFVYKLTSCSR